MLRQLFGRLSESASGLHRDQGSLAPHLELLYSPGVAIGVGEAEKGTAIALVEYGDFASVDSAVN